MKVYDYRIVEDLNLKTLKLHFFIEYYHLTEKKYHFYSNDTFQTLQEAQEAIRLIRKYKEPLYHYVEWIMTKLTALDLYILTDTIIHSLQFGSSWSGVATKEARDGVLNKLQKIMSEIEVEVSVEKPNEN